MGQSLYRDGLRYLADGTAVQRYLCRGCGYRFSYPKGKSFMSLDVFRHVDRIHTPSLYSPSRLSFSRQGSGDASSGAPSALKAVKTLATVENPNKDGLAGATEKPNEVEVKGKIIEFLWWAEKQGYAKETVRGYGSCLRALMYRGANLLNPESVKEVLAKERSWSANRRRNVINAYTTFIKFNKIEWEKPKCKVEKKIPFIPMEQEIDTLIAGSNKRLAAFLQLLKETAMRSGEAFNLLWSNIDFERRLIILNNPEKGSNPRIFKISQRLIDMLNALPRKSQRIFSNKTINSLKATFIETRKRIAHKLQNPRLLKISFHTFRHWKATMEYHRTKDILYVKNLLGHKILEHTELYINLEKAIFGDTYDQEYHVKVASTPQEIKALLEVGYEYVCEKDSLLFFRKRK
jgi:integrase